MLPERLVTASTEYRLQSRPRSINRRRPFSFTAAVKFMYQGLCQSYEHVASLIRVLDACRPGVGEINDGILELYANSPGQARTATRPIIRFAGMAVSLTAREALTARMASMFAFLFWTKSLHLHEGLAGRNLLAQRTRSISRRGIACVPRCTLPPCCFGSRGLRGLGRISEAFMQACF